VRAPVDRAAWLLPAALALLLTALGVLQYRWTGEIGRAEAERLRASLEGAARRFALGLDVEVGRVFFAFRFEPERSEADDGDELLQRLRDWRTQAEHARLVSRVVLLARGRAGVVAESGALDADALSPTTLSPQLEAVARRLEPEVIEAERRAGPRGDSLLDQPLALVLPVLERGARPSVPFEPRSLRARALVVVELDESYLRDHLLPQLAETHFGPLEHGDFTVAVVRQQDGQLVYASDPQVSAAELRHGDVQQDLLAGPRGPGRGEGRFGPVEEGRPDRREDVERALRFGGRFRPRPGAGPPLSAETGLWRLVVRHRGGSLAESVAVARRRNLAVGLGVLGLLGGAAVLLALGGQRARRLAHQQLEFVAGISHELNTPLTAIRSAAQNLADGIVVEPEPVRRYGELIRRESDRLIALVGQVLDFAGIQAGSRAFAREPIALQPIVQDAVRDCDLALEQAGLAVRIDVAADLPELRGDAPALRRAFENLLNNAARFAAATGELLVRARRSPRGAALITFEDRGPGIPEQERERVFEPFFRGRVAQQRQAPGSGLGLSLVRHIVEGHGGQVCVEAREGGGSCVRIELPAADEGRA